MSNPPDMPPCDGPDELREMAKQLGVRVVKPATLRKYGLTEDEWLRLLADQGWKCPVCNRRLTSYVTDHEHIPLYTKRPPEERAMHVRGILCTHDNYNLLPYTMTADKAERIATYLRAYQERKRLAREGDE